MQMIPRTDKHQALRVKRLLMSITSWIMFLGVVWLAWLGELVYLTAAEFALVSCSVMVIQAGFFVVIRSGFNKRFKDPSMTAIQIVNALLWVTFLLGVTREIRGTMISIYFTVILFGTFKLDRRGFWVVSLVPVIGYGLIILRDSVQDPMHNWRASAVQWLFLCFFLNWLSSIGSYIRDLRMKLKERKSELEESHRQLTLQRDEIQGAHNDLEKALAKLGELAVRDELTGLFNRRQLMASLEANVTGAKRTRIGVCLLDMDHFKQINDTFGHLAGDEVIKAFADLLQRSVRDTDVVARYGGEEFVMVLPGADEEVLMRCAERVREGFRAINFDHLEPGRRFTVSIGATQNLDGESIETVLARADAALYEAKNGGRNQTVFRQAPELPIGTDGIVAGSTPAVQADGQAG